MAEAIRLDDAKNKNSEVLNRLNRLASGGTTPHLNSKYAGIHSGMSGAHGYRSSLSDRFVKCLTATKSYLTCTNDRVHVCSASNIVTGASMTNSLAVVDLSECSFPTERQPGKTDMHILKLLPNQIGRSKSEAQLCCPVLFAVSCYVV